MNRVHGYFQYRDGHSYLADYNLDIVISKLYRLGYSYIQVYISIEHNVFDTFISFQ